MKNTWILLGLVLTTLACNRAQESMGALSDLAAPSAQAKFTAPVVADEPMDEAGSPVVSVGRKLIKNGRLSFESDDLSRSTEEVKLAVKRLGGYVSNESNDNGEAASSCNLTIRVPSARFDSLMTLLTEGQSVRKVDSKSVSITDVTTQYIDAKTRLDIKKAAREKLNALFAKASNLSETLEIQKQLTDLQAEIESYEGQLKYLNDQVDFSTLDVSFHKDRVAGNGGFFHDFFQALLNGWSLFLKGLVAVGNLWLVLLFIYGLVWIVQQWKKRKKAKAKEETGK